MNARDGSIAFRLLAVVALLGAVSCKDGQAPIRPQTLAIQEGNNQSGPTGLALPVPLQVLLLGSDGLPFVGATVRWQVVSGSGQVAPPTSTTDQAGIAVTMLTLGTALGPIVVSATVDGLTPVSFTAIAIDACTVTADYTVGSTIDGTLGTGDCRLGDGTLIDRYRFTIAQQQSIRFSQSATGFNTFLLLEDAMRRVLGFNDDVTEVDINSSMRVFLAPAGYVIAPSGFGPADAGAYTLTSAPDNSVITGCVLFDVWLTIGVQLDQDLADTDCVLEDQQGNLYYADPYFLQLTQGTTLTVRQTSTAVDTYLELYRLSSQGFDFVAFNDDENDDSTDSLLTHTVAVGGTYVLLPSSAAPVETGAYRLIVE